MRISAPITVSALVVAGLVATGSGTNATRSSTPDTAPEALLAASTGPAAADGTSGNTSEAGLSRTVGLLPVTPEAPRKLRAMTPLADGTPLFAGSVPLHDIALPVTGGALGIPEIVLAAYRNAELALESSMPGCGLSWSLLAGIGRIESLHAGGGRTDAGGTTVTPIFGPALDGSLPGNEVIKAADGSAVRAIGPMQFLPGTWGLYAADGNGDGVADPHNVFDASLAAGKYLCSGGLNLRDPQQELRAVLRYNNSLAYAANVLSWSAAYRTGGTPSQVNISPDLIPPGTAPITAGPDMLAASSTAPTTTTRPQLPPNTVTIPTPTEVMINIPGLPPIPCGIFCPRPVPKPPCDPQQVAPAQLPAPGDPAQSPIAPAQNYGAAENGEPKDPQQQDQQHPDQQPPQRPANCIPAQPDPAQPAPAPNAQNPAQSPGEAPQPEKTPEPGVADAPEPTQTEAATPPPAPGITLPFGIVIPLPAPAPAPQG
ncbi:lytic murein transglycosylase [Nocardia anaemiae]|uniref:lytic murein transglycosylase n=1 Tax=Nocardia anaemiae TaxID=263910 RepID=UPI0007A46617|nr:lytic murein transglycosylase [Nocardia anaemiae]